MTQRLSILSSTILLLIAACSPAATPSPTIEPSPSPTEMPPHSLCLVTDVGKVDDGTFNQYAYEGMIDLTENYAGLSTSFVETLEQDEYGVNIQQCLDNEAEIIITVGFFLEAATVEAARNNPDIFFIGVDQDATAVEDSPANYVGMQAREDQAGFLVGAIAALIANAQDGNVIAGVYGIDVPAVKRFRNGYEQGALYINPDWLIGENILGSYTDSFTDPEQGATLANEFIAAGAVVIFGAGGPTGSGAIRAAAEQGVYVIGVDQDEYFTTFQSGEGAGVEYLVTSAVKRVDRGVYDVAAILIEGRFMDFPGGRNYILDVANNGVGFSPSHDASIDEAIFEQASEIFRGLVNEEISTGVDPATGDLLTLEEATPEATSSSD